MRKLLNLCGLLFAFCLNADAIYVNDLSSGRLLVIDPSTNTIIATINTTNSQVRQLALTPNTQFLYAGSNGPSVSVIDTSTNTLITNISGFNFPNNVVASNQFAYVADETTLYAISVSTNTVVATLPSVGGSNNYIGLTPNGERVYSYGISVADVFAIDGTTNNVLATIPVSTMDNFNCFASNKKAYVIGEDDANTLVIDTTTNIIDATIPVIGTYAAFSPSGNFLYVVSGSPDSQVLVVNTASDAIVATIPLADNQPLMIAIRPDGAFGYVPNAISSGVIEVIDLSSYTVTATISTGGSSPTWIVCSPDNQFIYACVSNFFTGHVLAISTSTNLIVATIPVGISPSEMIYFPPFIPPTPSFSGPIGMQVIQRFLTQSDYVNIISWSAPTGFTPVAYLLYRDAGLTDLAADLPATEFEFYDHNRVKKAIYTYYLIATDADGDTLNMGSVQVLP